MSQDRSNIANARVAGLQNDLKLTNQQYSIALTITYVPYIAAELPSNLLLKVQDVSSDVICFSDISLDCWS